ncbi:hypothetical protein J2810_001724 [Chryseobacterium rhizosphaerae]|nr:hypothetical protein [Chryseobacterium rhizosphaerae]
MDFSSIFNYLQDHVKRKILNFLVLIPFWTIPFTLFKPDFFDYPIYVQLSFLFCLSLCWYLVHVLHFLLFTSIFLIKPERTYDMMFEYMTSVGIFFICIFILIGYYFSVSMTKFLLIAFVSMAALISLYLIVGVIKEIRGR